MKRREILALGGAVAMAPLLGAGRAQALIAEGPFEVTRSDAEWRAMLSSAEYRVMREGGTERAGSSPLDREYRAGMFHCRGCDLAVYASEHKYDSGTGWPSFWRAQRNAIGTMDDRRLLRVRTECHCRRCGSHFGHIFGDGPQPTGDRHCLNGVSLVFRAA